MTKEELVEMVRKMDNPDLADKPGMVHQIWQDGELTCQKSGDLLWQRSLHCFEPALPGAAALGLEFPHTHGPNSYAWVTSEDAYTVRDAFRQLLGIEGTDRLRNFGKR